MDMDTPKQHDSYVKVLPIKQHLQSLPSTLAMKSLWLNVVINPHTTKTHLHIYTSTFPSPSFTTSNTKNPNQTQQKTKHRYTKNHHPPPPTSQQGPGPETPGTQSSHKKSPQHNLSHNHLPTPVTRHIKRFQNQTPATHDHVAFVHAVHHAMETPSLA